MSEDLQQGLALRIDLDHRINFAMQQNDVPVVKALRVENNSTLELRDIECRIAVEPSFALPWATRIAAIAPGSSYDVKSIDLELLPAFLWDLTEGVRGKLVAEVTAAGGVTSQTTIPIDLLARDEWGGLSSLPEILAAFVTPNNPAVEATLRTAAASMSQWTGDPSLNGYQSQDPRRVYRMAGAVYAALQQLGLTYVNPPASFEQAGQRVRLPDRIVWSKMATCLDLALFAAACLEQSGLHPLVIVVRGHAFTGVWLNDQSFPEPSIEDGLRLRKRVDLTEIAVFDPTGVTARPALSFEQAVLAARKRLEAPDTFLCAIDVFRARKGRIRPLPEHVARQATSVGAKPAPDSPIQPPTAPDTSGIVVGARPNPSEGEASETPASRLDRWRRKLLDLSLRNRLLNFRATKKTLPLLCPDLGMLEDKLAAGSTFHLFPRPKDLGPNDPRDAATHTRRTGEEGLESMLLEELQSSRLHANSTQEDLDRRTVEIYRAARLGLEEGGASALYLALGFLVWYETEKSEQPRRAPILLLPVELHRKSIREGFTLSLAAEDPRVNVTLLEMLRLDFEISIPGLDPLPEDDSGLDVAGILRRVREAIRDIDRWDVVEDAKIGLFSFAKFLMWRDLNERVADLLKNPVVSHLVNRPNEPFVEGGPFPRADRLDDERKPNQTFCPLSADSSQLAAIVAAAEGRSFVLEGPPGTGKSQTITNLIAHCLAEGKTVLFVSEKMAALDVVHRRLVEIGLQRYCLQLHSNKAHKQDVIRQLAEALHQASAHSEAEWARETERLAALRSSLNGYVHALHDRRSTGETVFQATSRLIGLRDIPRVELRWPGPEALEEARLSAIRDAVERLATAGANCGEVAHHPLSTNVEKWSRMNAEKLTTPRSGRGAAFESAPPFLSSSDQAGLTVGA